MVNGFRAPVRRQRRPFGAVLLLACIAAVGASACAVDPVLVCPANARPIGVTVAPASDTVVVGDTAWFRAVVTLPSDYPGGRCGAAPDPTTSRAVTWELSNGAVGTIMSSNDSTIVVRGAGVGTSSVIATAKADATAKAAALLVVPPAVLPGGALQQRHEEADR